MTHKQIGQGHEIATYMINKATERKKMLIGIMERYAKEHSWFYVYKLVKKMKPSASLSSDDIDFMTAYAKARYLE